ncbi:MAG: M24 family metallopeptidase [Anaerolineales bacterium]
MQASIAITKEEYAARAARLREHVRAHDLRGVVLFNHHYILYFTGFAFIPTERPMAFAMNAAGERALYVPRLELEHAQADALIDRVDHYPEYPHEQHPMKHFGTMLAEMGIRDRIGADHDGYPWVFGYRGPSLSEFTGAEIRPVAGFVEDQMMIKSEAELALLRASCTWGNLAHTLLQRYTAIGATETEVSDRASTEATRHMLDAIGPLYRAHSEYMSGAHAGYRGQIGRNASIPHALANNITFQPGDVLVTGAAAPMWGYYSELERTLIIAPVSEEHRRMFDHMLALQDTAFAAIRPGATCSDVDRAVRKYYEDNDLIPYWKHHVGHAIGLRYHEGPFLDIGDDTEIRPGMVFTVEPGLYASNLGGFRHSDTVAVTEDGIEMMTYYPRDLEGLTI